MPNRVLFKYRGLEPWPYLLDALVHQRLHAATFHQLNDPMEGVFYYYPDAVTNQFVDRIVDRKGSLGICALSAVHNSSLMWSYYASGHKGIVLGVEIDMPTAAGVIAVENVNYEESSNFHISGSIEPNEEAKRVLSRKLATWRHEQEVRVFTHSAYFPVSIKYVYLGCKMESETEALLRPMITRLLPQVEIRKMDRCHLDRPEIAGGI
jgi:hypothetical protein